MVDEVILTYEEEKKYNTISKVEEGTLTRKEASFDLKLTLRQIDRLRIVYRNEGKIGFTHKNKGKSNQNKKDRQIIESLEQLYLSEYYDYNFEAFYEVIESNYNISYSVMYNEFKIDDIISPIAHKQTVRLYNEKMENAISSKDNMIQEEKIELFQSRILQYEKAHPRKSSNMFGFGQEIQMDACVKIWFGGIATFLHLAVDKGTKKVLSGWFDYEEITRGYFILLYNIIINYGIPERIKTDNRNSFSNQKNKVDTTQFGIICNTLGIELITTSIATAKANIERENKTFKDRLISELRHENITTIDEANYYLNNIFIPKMNNKFSYQIDSKTSKMKTNNYTEEELNLIISEKYQRIIDNASSIKYQTRYYVPVDPNTGEVVSFLHKTKCTFIVTYNCEYWCEIENNYYKLLEIESRDTTMKKEKDKQKVETKKIKYSPPNNSPWRKNMMRKY